MAFWEKRQKENTNNFKRKYMCYIKYSEDIVAKYQNRYIEKKKYNCAKNDDYIKCSENIYVRYKEGILGH